MPIDTHFVMSPTIFSGNGDLDESGFRRWLRRFADSNLGVYVGSGGNGEGHALRPEELRRVYEVAVDELKGKVPVHANLPEEHTAEKAVAQARIAVDAGIDILHFYPIEGRHGMKPTDRELLAYFDDVFSAIDHPASLAINPTVGIVPRPAMVAEIVRRHPQIQIVRLSHQPDIYLINLMRAIEREITYSMPLEIGTLESLALGATLFSGDANLLPKTFRQLVDLYAAGDHEGIRPLLVQLRRFREYTSSFGSVPRWTKMAMRGLKLPGGEGSLRKPYLMPPQEEIDAFVKGLVALGIPEIEASANEAGLA